MSQFKINYFGSTKIYDNNLRIEKRLSDIDVINLLT